MRYFESVVTGQVYERDCEPAFGGYEEVTKEDYVNWQIKTFGKIEYLPIDK